MKENGGKFDFGVAVIGGGSGGYAAARTAAAAGLKTVVIEGGEEVGGLCILRGCMPSKTLIYSGEVLHLARRGADFGLRVPGATADMGAMQARKRRIIGEFARHRVSQHRGTWQRRPDLGRAFPDRNRIQGQRAARSGACGGWLLDERRRARARFQA
jgi:NADPH-dependent 2,4-dienoyl-CoA reductase/sulfur reductase-like enzyme